jgi:signal transduction histidine kinase/CHASE3 domain sensor protein
MRFGLTARILFVGGLATAFLVVESVLILSTLSATRAATDQEERAAASASAAQRVEKLVLDLETGVRGYILTHNNAFLKPWSQARKQLPAASAQLQQTDPSLPAMAIEDAWQRYEETWSDPLVALARTNPKQAENRLTQDRAKDQVDQIRKLIDGYVATRTADAARFKQRVSDDEHRAVVTAAVGIGLTALLFLGIVAYLLRAAVVPLRRLAGATGVVAAGDFDVRVPEEGAGEVGELAAAFNEMAASLSRQQSSLAEQNVDLERLANVLRAVLDSTVDGILLSDNDGNVQLANRPVVEMTRDLGVLFEGTVTERLLSIAPRIKDRELYVEAMEQIRDTPGESTFNEFEVAESGRVYQGWTSAVLDDNGSSLGRIWTLREVTRQRELDRLKDDFVATVSHELRTPLTSMMGFLQMIREGEAGEVTAEQERFLAIVYRSSERLQRLVGDLLFVARLDASGIQLQRADVRFDEVVNEALEAVSGSVKARELRVETAIEEVPAIDADRERLVQLISNLLSNAVKFTPAGGTLTARVFSNNGNVVAEVEDTGIGIPEAEQDRMFQRFFRSTTATAQAIPGTGLGLVISKAIAEAHGGCITMRSRPGLGTCFRVELPIERTEVE